MGRPAKESTKTVKEVENSVIETPRTHRRPASYISQPGIKATFSLADFEDAQLFGELRRRGYTGELRFSKVVTI